MLKFKSPITKLSSAIAFCLIANAASAANDIMVYETYKYLDPEVFATRPINNSGDWAAAYFKVNSSICEFGCDLTSVSLLMDLSGYDTFSEVPLQGKLTLDIYSNKVIGTRPDPFDKTPPIGTINRNFPDQMLLTLTTPVSVTNDGDFGKDILFTAPVQNSPTSLLQPNTEYWIKLSNASNSPFGWVVNGSDKPNEFYAHFAHGATADGYGSPRIFQINGIARDESNSGLAVLPISHVPLPGAFWFMGSALLGLPAVLRRKSVSAITV